MSARFVELGLDGHKDDHATSKFSEPVLLREKGGGQGKNSNDGGGGKSGSKAAPTDIYLTSDLVDENAAGGTLVGRLGAVDADRNDSFTFRLIDNAGGRFLIDGDQLIVADGSLLDFELADSHSITVQVTDKFGLTYTEVIEITVNDVDEGNSDSPPSDIALSALSIAENSSDGTLVGVVSASDPDGDGPLTFVLTDDADARFALDGDRLVVADGSRLDFETVTSHDITIQVTDAAGNSYNETFTIAVTDVAEAGAPATEPLQVPDYVLEGLLIDGVGDTEARWNAGQPLGSAVTVTYSFLDVVPDYYADNAAERDGFLPLTAEQQSAVREILALIEQFTNITFLEKTDTVGDLAFGTADLPQGSAWAYYPSLTSPTAGDVWIDNQIAANDDVAPGGDGFKTLLHEIGHALGLKHPHESPGLPADEQNRKFTVMSYAEHPEMGGWEPTGYLLYDVAALQYLYGANADSTAGNDVYDLSNTDGLLTAIWDSGGYDVLDASGSASGVVLNLNQASFSTSGTVYGWYPATDNVALAFGTVIEEARGGNGNDTIISSSGDNWLTGGGGADHFVFAADWGSDVILDFQDGLDLIDLSALPIGFADLSVDASDGSALIGFGDDTILLSGVSISLVDDSDFLFGTSV